MNKRTLRFAGWALGLSMAVAGIGATIGTSGLNAIEAKAESSTITFDFEDNTAHRTSGSNSYSSTANEYKENSIDIYLVYADSVTTGSPLGGSANITGRIAKNTTNSPTIKIGNFDFQSNVVITDVSYDVQGVAAMTMNLEYSLDNSTWTTLQTFNMPTSKTTKSVSGKSIEATDFYLRWTVSVSSSTNSNRDFQLDNVVVTYEEAQSQSLDAVSVKTAPTKTTGYKVGETVDLTGLVITPTINEVAADDVAYDAETNADLFTTNPAVLSADTTSVKIGYRLTAADDFVYDNANSVSITMSVATVDGIVIDADAITTKSWSEGDTLDLTGLTYILSYSDESTSDEIIVASNADFADKGLKLYEGEDEVNLANSLTSGSHSYTVKYGEYSDFFAITVVSIPTYTLVTDVTQLTIGNKVIVTNSGATAAMKAYSSGNNCGKATVSVEEDGSIKQDDSVEFTYLTIGADSKGYTLKDENENYLYAASNSNNYLKGTKSLDQDGNDHWSISINASNEAVITAQGSNTHNLMRYNSSNSLFSCYSSGQGAIKLYVLDSNPSTADKVETFSQLFMHKADVSTSDKGTGKCISSSWFSNARSALSGDWSGIVEAFAQSGDMWDRYVAWGAAQTPKVTVTYDNGIVYGANPSSIFGGIKANQDKSYAPVLVIAITAFTGVIAAGGLFLVQRKRKHNEE